jgi:hypothetical protein
MIDIDAIFDDAYEARDNEGLCREVDTNSILVRLSCGDVHVCNCECEFAAVDRDGNRVCPLSGAVVGREAVDRTDMSTGRSTWSNDPDLSMPTMGVFRKKRDATKASAAAFLIAATLDDKMPTQTYLVKKTSRAVPVKRGAVCVDKMTNEQRSSKRHRPLRKDKTAPGTVRSVMLDEASCVFTKLMGSRRRKGNEKANPNSNVPSRETILTAALRKYAREQQALGLGPVADDVHNLVLAVDIVVERMHRESDTSEHVKTVEFRRAVSQLGAQICSAASLTPYLAEYARRGCDSLRPLLVGVFCSLKRGLALDDGTVLVPRVPSFAEALPSSKDIAADAQLKSLHASAHRGLRHLHRAIASVSTERALELFAPAIDSAKKLAALK